MAELKELVIKGPDPELHKVVRWRCVDLCEEIARRYSVRVTKGTQRRNDELLRQCRTPTANVLKHPCPPGMANCWATAWEDRCL